MGARLHEQPKLREVLEAGAKDADESVREVAVRHLAALSGAPSRVATPAEVGRTARAAR